ncbi:MAG: trypsin-like peptidase domain-containing protein [Clostridia bacterium]|nr:trypsin-like peptidase domain-containing protein [Clostridia bacterium]
MEENNHSNQEFKNVNPVKAETTYRDFQTVNQKAKSGPGFGKTVVLPFLCGALGTVIVIGTCVNVPNIKNAILQQLITNDTASASNETGTSNTTQQINTQLISLQGYSDTAIAVANKVRPSIVGITVEYSVNSIFNRTTSTATAMGSGIIISEDGYILTNNHVVNSSSSSSNSFYEIGKANKVTVKLYNDDQEYEGEIIGTDSQTDLAVIKINKAGLTPAELGDSSSVQVGEFTMAIGNPLGLENSVTAGIVSAVNREVTDEEGNKYTAIQTDAAINSGNSGGALVNSKGQVIGVNTLKLSGTGVEGVGFAIPINDTKSIYEQLIQYSKVKRPYIGIGGIDLDQRTADVNKLVVGIYIKNVVDFSAAEKAGLKVGDVIIEADGNKITTMDELNALKNKKSIGDTMKLKVYRDGKEKEVTVTLQEQP